MSGEHRLADWSDQNAGTRRLDEFAEEDEEDFLANAPPSGFQIRAPPPLEPLSDFLSPTPLTEDETVQIGKDAIRAFLSTRTVYDAMPKSGRVVVFDVNINLRLVLYALIEHEIRGAPLWSPSMQNLVGMITLTDFADIIRHSFSSGDDAAAILDTHTISSWRNLLDKCRTSNGEEVGRDCATSLATEISTRGARPSSLIFVPPNASLLEACRVLQRQNVHRLPIIDPSIQTCLQVINFQSVLEYLTAQFTEDRRLFDQSIYSLGVGSYLEPETSISCGQDPKPFKTLDIAYLNTPLEEVARMFGNDNIATVPILEKETRKIRDLYRRSYLACLNLEQPEPFQLPMEQVLTQFEASNPESLEPIRTCTPDSTLYHVFIQLAETKARTLVIVDDDGKFLGLCSLSDVLGHFL